MGIEMKWLVFMIRTRSIGMSLSKLRVKHVRFHVIIFFDQVWEVKDVIAMCRPVVGLWNLHVVLVEAKPVADLIVVIPEVSVWFWDMAMGELMMHMLREVWPRSENLLVLALLR